MEDPALRIAGSMQPDPKYSAHPLTNTAQLDEYVPIGSLTQASSQLTSL